MFFYMQRCITDATNERIQGMDVGSQGKFTGLTPVLYHLHSRGFDLFVPEHFLEGVGTFYEFDGEVAEFYEDASQVCSQFQKGIKTGLHYADLF
jgi:hypothetical protein